MPCRVRRSGSNQLNVDALAANRMVATLVRVTPLLLLPVSWVQGATGSGQQTRLEQNQ